MRRRRRVPVGGNRENERPPAIVRVTIMKYLGPARKQKDHVVMPDTSAEVSEGRMYEAVEVGEDILLVVPPFDREHAARIEHLATRSIEDAVVGLVKAFGDGTVSDPMNNPRYYNIKTMQDLGLK